MELKPGTKLIAKKDFEAFSYPYGSSTTTILIFKDEIVEVGAGASAPAWGGPPITSIISHDGQIACLFGHRKIAEGNHTFFRTIHPLEQLAGAAADRV